MEIFYDIKNVLTVSFGQFLAYLMKKIGMTPNVWMVLYILVIRHYDILLAVICHVIWRLHDLVKKLNC